MREENRVEEIELGTGHCNKENMPNENKDQNTFKNITYDGEIEDLSISLDWCLFTEM